MPEFKKPCVIIRFKNQPLVIAQVIDLEPEEIFKIEKECETRVSSLLEEVNSLRTEIQTLKKEIKYLKGE